jgi:hypothetical protein
MQYGLALPYWEPRKVAEHARLAEEHGWDGIFLGDAIWTFDPLISLAAAAMVTERVRLGTMIIPMPLRKPWKLASEVLALDYLSRGRVTLGLGAGAVWMGWRSFPDEVTDNKARGEMLDEAIDILTGLFQRQQFDYPGRHFKVKLSLMDPMHYPPATIQNPRPPLWMVGVYPKRKSMQRVLKCDGIFPQKMDAEGKWSELTPADVTAIRDFVQTNRSLTTPFDIVVEGQSAKLEPPAAVARAAEWAQAGATWQVESLFDASDEQVQALIRRGPPR